MKIEIVVPSPGESIAEVELATWMVANGSWVEKDQEIAEIESEKATLPLLAAQSGKLTILIEEGTVAVGAVVGTIDTSVQREEGETKKEDAPQPEEKKVEETQEIAAPSASTAKEEKEGFEKVKVTPVAQKMMAEKGLSVDDIISGLQRIDSGHVKSVLAQDAAPSTASPTSREQVREPMSQLRKKLSQRLVAVKNETAMLTTFNEVDMSNIMALRKDNQKAFVEKHGIKLGFMSLFAKAVVEGLKQYPLVNSYIENEEIVTPNYYDIGIAVQTPKGLMVPVVRSAEGLTIPQLEQEIQQLAEKGRKGRIGLDELSGGTFTITNGGIFGSLLSTPLLNPPQSGILGMHNIVERPVAINGKVEIRPMMYIALSYDHRLIDGRDAVSFLVAVKQQIENPELMLMGGRDMGQLLLDL